MIKIKFHSIVDVITNSSTTIFTYQNSVSEAKELVAEVLRIAGVTDKTPDDIFYYGVFCDMDTYFDYASDNEDPTFDNMPELKGAYKSEEREASKSVRDEWVNSWLLSIVKGDIERPEFMELAEDAGDYWAPSSYLLLCPKDDKYKDLGEKIKRLLSSVDADGGRDG
jgi:hypothetical protein